MRTAGVACLALFVSGLAAVDASTPKGRKETGEIGYVSPGSGRCEVGDSHGVIGLRWVLPEEWHVALTGFPRGQKTGCKSACEPACELDSPLLQLIQSHQSSFLEADRPCRASVRRPARAFSFGPREEDLAVPPDISLVEVPVELTVKHAQ